MLFSERVQTSSGLEYCFGAVPARAAELADLLATLQVAEKHMSRADVGLSTAAHDPFTSRVDSGLSHPWKLNVRRPTSLQGPEARSA